MNWRHILELLRKGLAIALCGICALVAGRAGAAPAEPPTSSARSLAPFDLTGTWVSVVTQDWRYRMVTPGRGEYAGIPLNRAAKDIADQWDPAGAQAAAEPCRAYGAAVIMRVPARLRITWADARTLRVEIDNGMQVRMLHFDERDAATATAVEAGSWQGTSRAAWDEGALKVMTRSMRPGLLRANGVPYSGDAELTEYWDLYREADGSQRLSIASIVRDPVYLQEPYGTSPLFRREPDASKWDPTPCKPQ
ncbi:hypothetical protein ACV229_27160 [Burkholderia sp. MR1-5-21]